MGRTDQKIFGECKMKKMKSAAPFVLLLLSVGLILAGIISGEAQIVFEKAIRICLECIGIG